MMTEGTHTAGRVLFRGQSEWGAGEGACNSGAGTEGDTGSVCFWSRAQALPVFFFFFLPTAKAVSPDLTIYLMFSAIPWVWKKVTFPIKYHLINIIYRFLFKRRFYYKTWRGTYHRGVQSGTKWSSLLAIAKESLTILPPDSGTQLKNQTSTWCSGGEVTYDSGTSTPIIPTGTLLKLTFTTSTEWEGCR